VLPETIGYHDQLLFDFNAKGASHILAELLDLLDLGGQVVGEGVLEGLNNETRLAFR
jgi:hypothetical protein